MEIQREENHEDRPRRIGPRRGGRARLSDLLERIVTARRASLTRERAVGGPRNTGAAGRGPAPIRSFETALRAPGRRIIAEIKRRSPSAGAIREPLDPSEIAQVYARFGAAALSVLTEADFFGGSDADLAAARAACPLAVLRKDFILDLEQIAESRAIGADAVLLLAAVLSPSELAELRTAAAEAGMAALVEVHDERELDSALGAGASIVGVNSRDLRDFSVDLSRAERLAPRIPGGVVRVAESGITTARDLARLEGAGFSVFLVGESLLRAPDPGARLRELLA